MLPLPGGLVGGCAWMGGWMVGGWVGVSVFFPVFCLFMNFLSGLLPQGMVHQRVLGPVA